MSRVAHQGVTIQILPENLLADADGFVRVRGVETQFLESLRPAFDDEGRGVLVELVGMDPDPPGFRLLEDEGEGVERLVRPEPDELVPTYVDVGLEPVRIAIADLGVDPVGGDDEVGVRVGVDVFHLRLENKFDPKFFRPRL